MEVKEKNNTTENIELKQENNVEKINDNKNIENEELKNNNIEKTNTDIQELNTDKIETNKNQEDSRTFKPLDEQQYKSKTKSDVLTIFAILCFIFVLLSLIIFGTFSFINLTSTKIAKGVYIKGIDVSGLTKEDATKKISSYVSSSIPEEIKLKHNDFETSLSTSQLSIYFNTEEAVNMAYNIGKNGNISIQTKLGGQQLQSISCGEINRVNEHFPDRNDNDQANNNEDKSIYKVEDSIF